MYKLILTAASRKQLGVEDLLSHKVKIGERFRSPICRAS